MESRRSVALAAALCSAFLPHCADVPDGTGQTAQAISGGTQTNEHPNVVGIVTNAVNGRGICTGSLILPNLVLTARHCVSETSQELLVCSRRRDPSTGETLEPTTAGAPYPVGSASRPTFRITWRPNIYSAGSNFIGASSVRIPADAPAGTVLCGKDIALLRLSAPVPGVEPIVPRLDIAPFGTEHFTAIGYGVTSDRTNDSGIRRIRSDGVFVELLGPQFLAPGVVAITESEFVASTGTCQGDSGGPAMDDLGQVFGILSRGGQNCSSPVYTRPDSYAEFIRAEARSAASAMGMEPPAWINPPEENSAQLGQPCSSDRQCASPLTCRAIPNAEGVFDRRICVDEDCAQCTTGFMCGTTQLGENTACIPDPNAMPVTPPDAGPITTADGGTRDGGTTMMRGTCSVASGTVGAQNSGWIALLAGLAMLLQRRKRD